MKLIRCTKCDDVVRLVHTEWRQCDCGKSGGQYNDDMISATVGGDCEVIGLRNDYFKEKPFSKERNEGGKNQIIEGEYEGDTQIHRIDSPEGPKLEMEIKENGDGTHDITFTDDRDYTINLKGDKSPKTLKGVESNKKPSFKGKKNESIDLKSIIREELILKDILSDLPLNENKVVDDSTFNKILDKVKKYAKRGLLTMGIITTLLGSTNMSQAQETQIKQVANIEMSVGETQSHEKEVKKLLKQGYSYEVGSRYISNLDAIANKLGKEVKRIEGKSNKNLNARQQHINQLKSKNNMKQSISLYNPSTNTLVIYFIS